MSTCLDLPVSRMAFDGHLLSKGFWLYVWKVRSNDNCAVYVGRTGDNSSPRAQSPFDRIGKHLDPRPNAKSNSLARQLSAAGMEPSECRFEMIAIGPLFEEQRDWDSHVPLRDEMAALEKGLANHLRQKGYNLLGQHNSRHQPDAGFLEVVVGIIDSSFPQVRKTKG